MAKKTGNPAEWYTILYLVIAKHAKSGETGLVPDQLYLVTHGVRWSCCTLYTDCITHTLEAAVSQLI